MKVTVVDVYTDVTNSVEGEGLELEVKLRGLYPECTERVPVGNLLGAIVAIGRQNRYSVATEPYNVWAERLDELNTQPLIKSEFDVLWRDDKLDVGKMGVLTFPMLNSTQNTPQLAEFLYSKLYDGQKHTFEQLLSAKGMLKNDPRYYEEGVRQVSQYLMSSRWRRQVNFKLGIDENQAESMLTNVQKTWQALLDCARKVRIDEKGALTLNTPFLKSEEALEKMAIADIPKGKRTKVDHGVEHYDYSHVLSPAQRANGYSIRLRHNYYRGELTATLHHRGMGIGDLDGTLVPSDGSVASPDSTMIHPNDVQIPREHRGKGLGSALYEALYSHAMHVGGATHVVGNTHSSMASDVHRRLSEKHGMNYIPVPNYGRRGARYPNREAWQQTEPAPYDGKFAPYQYSLKSEEPLEKGSLQAKKPFNPSFDGVENRYEIRDWQMGWRENREGLPEMPPLARFRALHRLHGATKVRRGADGKREFLLHRGMGDEEHAKSVVNGTVTSQAMSSWSPTQWGASHVKHKVSAWVPESAIHLIPNQLGRMDLYNRMTNTVAPGGQNEMHPEYEVITKPHVAKLADPTELAKSETHDVNLENEGNVSRIAQDMAGFSSKWHAAFDAARFMSGRGMSIDFQAMRRALYEYDGDVEGAALHAYGIVVNDANRRALRAVIDLAEMNKIELDEKHHVIRPPEIVPTVPEGKEAAEEVERAFDAKSVEYIKLNGKHSKGTFIARDPKTDHVYLVKPGGGALVTAGANEEQASQSRREAAFYHVARLWDLEQYVPKADVLTVGKGQEWAAIRMLPFSYKNLEDKMEDDKQFVLKKMDELRENGTIHKWAVLDMTLGNTDRHGQNLMVGEDGTVCLIDHGSAFAGEDFAPATDKNSFIPFYLRYSYPTKFHALPAEEKLKYMPRVNERVEKELQAWIESLDVGQLEMVLRHYGIDPRPEIERLERIKAAPLPKDLSINKMWVSK